MDDDGWTCAKCDGAADVALHSRHCPLRGQEGAVSVVDWSAVHILQRRETKMPPRAILTPKSVSRPT